MPLFNFESAFSIRIFLVSAFFPDIIQQIHSFRASGVMSSQIALISGLEIMAFCISAGTGCTVPLEIPFLTMR